MIFLNCCKYVRPITLAVKRLYVPVISKNNLISYNYNKVFDINTNVPKDVLIFKYDSPGYFRVLRAFAFCQFCFWSYLSHFAYTTLRDVPIDFSERDDLPFWRKINLGDERFRIGLSVAAFAVGNIIVFSVGSMITRSVRYLVLKKGGESLNFVTYGIFGKDRSFTVKLGDVCCKESREVAAVQVPLKVKNKFLHYILDKRGEFTNPKLFDNTAGLYRSWK